MIIENNYYQGARFFNSSNYVTANVIALSNSTKDFFSLRQANLALAEENSRLREQMAKAIYRSVIFDSLSAIDSSRLNQYEYISARVINNSTRMFRNHITINKGSRDGIQPGMAVLGPDGIVGKIKNVSNHYAVLKSLLHVDVMVSSRIKRTGHVGTVQWGGYDPLTADLNFIPRHVKLQKGDTIVTSGFNAIFPEGILIGTIEEISITDEAVFYELKIKLSQDFNKLSYVYVVKNNMQDEQEMLENESIEFK